MGAIARLLGTLHQILPGWAYMVLVALLAVVALPTFVFSMRARQIRSAVRRVARATTIEARREAEDDAFALTADHPRLLTNLAEEALRLNQRAVFDRVVTRLTFLGGHDAILASFAKRQGPAKTSNHPIEAAIAVRRLIEAGLLDRARDRLDEADARFPGDPELAVVRQELTAATSPPPVSAAR